MLCICYVMGRVVCSLVSNQVGIELCIPFITYLIDSFLYRILEGNDRIGFESYDRVFEEETKLIEE